MIYFEGSVSSLMGSNSTSIKQGITHRFQVHHHQHHHRPAISLCFSLHSLAFNHWSPDEEIDTRYQEKRDGKNDGQDAKKIDDRDLKNVAKRNMDGEICFRSEISFFCPCPGALFPLFFSFPLLAQCSGQPASATILHRRYRRNISQQNKDHPRPLSRSSFVCPLRSVWLVHVAGAVDWMRVDGGISPSSSPR